MNCWRALLDWLRSVLVCFFVLTFSNHELVVAEDGSDTATAELEESKDRPSPQVPAEALFLGEWGNVELLVTADAEGKILKAEVSKPSEVGVFDEHIRSWVEKHWKMPRAQAGQTGSRAFRIPIVLPDKQPWGEGRYPAPSYPSRLLRSGAQGKVVVLMKVALTGAVGSATVIGSSGSKELDDHTITWVKRFWQFPAAKEPRSFYWPCRYIMQGVSSAGSLRPSEAFWKTGWSGSTSGDPEQPGKYPQPPYPEKLQHLGFVGKVGLVMTVAPNGRVVSAKVDRSSGSQELDEYSVVWVKKKWRFPPADRGRSYQGFCQYGQETAPMRAKDERKRSAKR